MRLDLIWVWLGNLELNGFGERIGGWRWVREREEQRNLRNIEGLQVHYMRMRKRDMELKPFRVGKNGKFGSGFFFSSFMNE